MTERTPTDHETNAQLQRPVGVGAALLLLLVCVPTRGDEPSIVTSPAPSLTSSRPSVFDGTLGDKEPSPEISTKDLQQALRDPRTVLLDSRPVAEFAVSHIPGARSVAAKAGSSGALYVADVNDAIRTVPDKTRPVVIYCNGLHCGRSKRFAAELLKAGYASVRRYQLGIPAWRALGGTTQIEKDALLAVVARDRTAVLIDGRNRDDVGRRLAGAVPIPLAETTAAKDDGRLPMTDHNTRILVVGRTGTQARAVADAIVRDAFHNVAFFAGSIDELSSLHARK
jgi:rhodanese-related sulfurtransferase